MCGKVIEMLQLHFPQTQPYVSYVGVELVHIVEVGVDTVVREVLLQPQISFVALYQLLSSF